MIRVKLVSKTGGGHARLFRRQLPAAAPVWGRCEFLVGGDERDYDWLVVYDDVPADPGFEPLRCPAAHTLLITVEPSSIKRYAGHFVRQFGHVLTSHEPGRLDHRGVIRSQPGLIWFYGRGRERLVPYDELAAAPPAPKTRPVATVCSTKRHRHTVHRRRFAFTQELAAMLPELEVFGRGWRPIDDKAEAIAPYRFHVAVENHVGPHHWTEKLADAFLGYSVPLYFGCPNAADYFPADSFIPIDIHDARGTAERIRAAIRDDESTARLPAVIEARRRVLERYNLFAELSRLIEARHDPSRRGEGGRIVCRRRLRWTSPAAAAADLIAKLRRPSSLPAADAPLPAQGPTRGAEELAQENWHPGKSGVTFPTPGRGVGRITLEARQAPAGPAATQPRDG